MSMAWIRQSDFMKWASEAPLIVDWLRCHEEFVRSKPDEVKHQERIIENLNEVKQTVL